MKLLTIEDAICPSCGISHRKQSKLILLGKINKWNICYEVPEAHFERSLSNSEIRVTCYFDFPRGGHYGHGPTEEVALSEAVGAWNQSFRKTEKFESESQIILDDAQTYEFREERPKKWVTEFYSERRGWRLVIKAEPWSSRAEALAAIQKRVEYSGYAPDRYRVREVC